MNADLREADRILPIADPDHDVVDEPEEISSGSQTTPGLANNGPSCTAEYEVPS